MSSRVDLDQDVKDGCIGVLNFCLANTVFAQLCSKHAHWNVKGPGFFPAHKLFDKVHEFYLESADRIGERITALGGVAEGMISDISGNSELVFDASDHGVSDCMEAMADLMGQVANYWRDAVNTTTADKVTQNLLLELTEEADKMLYFLEHGL